MGENSQARRWVLTINNPTQTDEEMFTYIKGLEHFKYVMFQREKGEEKGTEHFQIYLTFTISKRFNTVKSYFPTAHIEKANGTNVQCRDYCSKSETRVSGPYEDGQFTEERARNDIKALMELISAGADNQTIKDLFPNQYFRYFDKIERLRQEDKSFVFEDKLRQLEVTYIYGKSGIGKSYNLVKEYGLKNVYRVTDYYKDPWYAYKGQDIVIFEEFRGQFRISEMLNYLDIYPLWLPARYSSKVACYTKVFITTNIPLEKQYPTVQAEEPETWQAFKRRIHKIYKYDELGKHEIVKPTQMDILELTEQEKKNLPF